MQQPLETESAFSRLTRRAALRNGTAGLATTALLLAASFGHTDAGAAGQEATTSATPEAIQENPTVPDLTGVTPLSLTDDRLTRFDVHAQMTLAALGVPGASIAVVQDGEVVFAKGFGVRETGQAEPVTPDTLLRIGSVTKSFSALLTATLVDEGRLEWTTPLVELLPDFAVADESLTSKLTIADAFSAATGLPRRDMELFFNGDKNSAEEVVASLRELPLTAPYGTKYQYNNQMVAAGGFAAANADNDSGDDLAQAYRSALNSRVLEPIGMTATTLSIDDVTASGDYATPHGANLAGEFQPLPLLNDDRWVGAIAPSGALWSSVRDMARYLQTQLARGVAPDAVQMVSIENLERTWELGIEIPLMEGFPEELSEVSGNYALGWVTGTYGGQRVIWHSGGTLGFASLATFLPDAGLGVVTLTNGSGLAPFLFTMSVQFQLLEVLFDLPPVFDRKLIPLIEQEDQARADLLENLGEVDPGAVRDYLGRYANPDLGELSLLMADGVLLLTDGELSFAMLPKLVEVGTVTAYVPIDPPFASSSPQVSVTLQTGANGPEMIITVPGESAQDNLVYTFVRGHADATPSS